MKNVEIKTNETKPYLKHEVWCNGKLVGEHNILETCYQQKEKILKPIVPPTYKGKKLI